MGKNKELLTSSSINCEGFLSLYRFPAMQKDQEKGGGHSRED